MAGGVVITGVVDRGAVIWGQSAVMIVVRRHAVVGRGTIVRLGVAVEGLVAAVGRRRVTEIGGVGVIVVARRRVTVRGMGVATVVRVGVVDEPDVVPGVGVDRSGVVVVLGGRGRVGKCVVLVN